MSTSTWTKSTFVKLFPSIYFYGCANIMFSRRTELTSFVCVYMNVDTIVINISFTRWCYDDIIYAMFVRLIHIQCRFCFACELPEMSYWIFGGGNYIYICKLAHVMISLYRTLYVDLLQWERERERERVWSSHSTTHYKSLVSALIIH